MQIGEHFACPLGLNHAPGALPFSGRQCFQQPGDFGGVHALQQFTQAFQLALGQCLAHGFKMVALMQVVRQLARRWIGLGRITEQLGFQGEAEVLQGALFQIGVDLLPQRQALRAVEALQQGGDFARVHAGEQFAHAFVFAVSERLGNGIAFSAAVLWQVVGRYRSWLHGLSLTSAR